jgi:catechol 2,3-dioxygenase-like lactoylglutathione lyase family enzyme
MTLRLYSVVFDARDPSRLAAFWSAALGFPVVLDGPEEAAIKSDYGESSRVVFFVAVSEQKAGKNRLHLDVEPDDQVGEVERLLALGARRVDIGQHDVPWVVLADPEGNEFCVLESRPT